MPFECYDSCGSDRITAVMNFELFTCCSPTVSQQHSCTELLNPQQYIYSTYIYKPPKETNKMVLIDFYQKASLNKLILFAYASVWRWRDQMCLYLSSQNSVLNPSPGRIRYQLYRCVWPQPCSVWWF